MYQELLNKQASLAVIGLGYVGLPLALAFAKKFKVLGFDIKPQRVAMMRQAQDPSRELDPQAFENCDVYFTAELQELKQAQFYVVAVPTPIDEHNVPDLSPLLGACRSLAKVLKRGDCVVFESTVYPGCTEEDCLPLLEAGSGLKAGQDFAYGYSPERINPGDKIHTLERIVKVVSGHDAQSLDLIAKVYETIIEAGVFRAASVKVAEAAKIIENTQRDLNIALMNELSVIFNKMGIPTSEVLAAARTKWNFLPFYPGLVGGHCIGVDPYYLTHKAQQLGYNPQVILSGRRINDGMANHVAQKTVQALLKKGKNLKEARLLVLGLTFKEDVSDIRNSKVIDLIRGLEEYYPLEICVSDPLAEAPEVAATYGLNLSPLPNSGAYDAILVCVAHQAYRTLTYQDLAKWAKDDVLLVDLKSLYNPKDCPPTWTYWSL